MGLTRDDLFASPDHYLHSFEGNDAIFVPMNRDSYRRSIFLDGRITPAGEGSMRIPGLEADAKTRRRAATGWIFHIAHCGSTLLARALDHHDTNLVLREPLALRQTAIAHASGQTSPDRLALVAATLSKRYHADLPTIVKANVPVNFYLPEIAALNPDARAIFLYLPLRDYLLAILRSDNHRQWLRRVTATLSLWLGDTHDLSDGERVAALWLGQMRVFAAALEVMPGGRTLNAESFFAEPDTTLSTVARHLQVPLSAGRIAHTVSGVLFSTYSKNPEVPFDNAERLARRESLTLSLSDEMLQAACWLEARPHEVANYHAVIETHRLCS